ncbi:hypothetical protein AB4Y32_34715 [Paraburkholderia phymatum]|uniref:Uncharacterized protein n=1 Tax=Paraburkholderia phymatum TaxID=148447 RepID=A0ACC6UB08_9BURK
MRAQQVSKRSAEEVILAVSLELAMAKWKVGLHDGRRDQLAVHTVTQTTGRILSCLQAMLSLIEQRRQKWALPAELRSVVSSEAGQDAFWLYHALQARGIECYVVDPANLQAGTGAHRVIISRST